jgi:hypothetical protein
MARIRTIKPEFFTSEDIVSLSPYARLLYIALWCESDKEGRFVWKPATFKLRYLPGDSCDVQALCDELTKAGLVVLYGQGYAYIPAFKAHQHINPRESASQLPDPDASTTRQPRVGTRHSRDSDAQGGREGKGKEGNESPPAPQGGERFEDFWLAWPKNDRKQDKAKCREKWVKAGLDALADVILADVKAKRGTAKWRDGFIEAPEVYLNNRRWEDGVAVADWWRRAGFADRFEAENAGCREHNAAKFRDGRRVEEEVE